MKAVYLTLIVAAVAIAAFVMVYVRPLWLAWSVAK